MAILAIAGGIGVVCVAGSATVAALKFFNTWEPDFSKVGKKSSHKAGKGPSSHRDSERTNGLRNKIGNNNSIHE